MRLINSFKFPFQGIIVISLSCMVSSIRSMVRINKECNFHLNNFAYMQSSKHGWSFALNLMAFLGIYLTIIAISILFNFLGSGSSTASEILSTWQASIMRSQLVLDFSQTVFPMVALGIYWLTDTSISMVQCSKVLMYSQTLDLTIAGTSHQLR